MGVISSTSLNLIGYLYRPFIDLTPDAPVGNPDVAGLILAIEALKTGKETRRQHGFFNDGVRGLIVRRAMHPEYDLDYPGDLQYYQWTLEWDLLCSKLFDFENLPTEEQERVLWLLFKMNMHKAVLRYSYVYVPKNPGASLIRALSKFAMDLTDVEELELVAQDAPVGSWAGIEATYSLAAIAAKYQRDLPRVEHWVEQHEVQVGETREEFVSLEAAKSRFYRVAAFIPMMRKDYKSMVKVMDSAEFWAKKIDRSDFAADTEARTVSSALYESRAREAALIENDLLRHDYAYRFVQESPLSPFARFALAEALENRGFYHETIRQYKLAARYGPPRDAEALWAAGHLEEDPEEKEALFIAAADLELLTVGETSESTREAIDYAKVASDGS